MVYEVKVVRALALREDGCGGGVGSLAELNSAEKVAAFWRSTIESSQWFDEDKECLIVFILNRKNRLIAYNLVSLGTATSSLAHPREIFRAACVAAGCAIILAHNHPSGDPAPSAADVQLTRKVWEAGEVMDIQLLDHVVVGRGAADPMGKGYYSFREAGII